MACYLITKELNYKSLTESDVGPPWRLSSRGSICQCRRHGFDPWARKIPHAAAHLSPRPQLRSLCARAQEPQLLSLCTTTTEA